MIEPASLPLQQIGLLAGSGVALAIAWRLIDLPPWVGCRVRRQFLLGVPWGTILTLAVVLGVYLTVQHGLDTWADPLVIPYRAWSFSYPLGIVTSGLAHASPGHLLGNLEATVIFAPIAEFAWGHFTPGRGRSAFGRLRDHPIVRILAVPVAAIAVALLTGAFAWGPVIGFSGVVFAFIGLAIVRHPVATLIAIVMGQGVGLGYRALVEPMTTASPGVTVTTPWWVGIAVQGHLLGLGIGVLAGVTLAILRDWDGSSAWIWVATVGIALEQSLWAIYWPVDAGYRLYRAVGVVAILVLAAVVTAAASARGPLFADPIGRAVESTRLARLDWAIPTRGAAITLLVAVLALTAAIGAAVNFQTIEADPIAGDDGVQIGDYRVTYAEHDEVEQISMFDDVVPETNLSWSVTGSGVIVSSPRRSIWTVAVRSDRLSRSNRATVAVGGPDWREDVAVRRRGWAVPDNRSAYAVDLRPSGGHRHRAFRSAPTTPNLSIDGRTVTLAPTANRFDLVVRHDGAVARGSVPWPGEQATVGDLTVTATEGALYASHDETRVRIAGRIGSPLDRNTTVVSLDRDPPSRLPADPRPT